MRIPVHLLRGLFFGASSADSSFVSLVALAGIPCIENVAPQIGAIERRKYSTAPLSIGAQAARGVSAAPPALPDR